MSGVCGCGVCGVCVCVISSLAGGTSASLQI